MSAPNEQQEIFIFKERLNNNFTIVPNQLLENPALSWKAKAIHCYILSRPETWVVRIEQLGCVSEDGVASTRSGIKELCRAGYWNRYPVYMSGKVHHYETNIFTLPLPLDLQITSVVVESDHRDVKLWGGESRREELTKGDKVAQMFIQNGRWDESRDLSI